MFRQPARGGGSLDHSEGAWLPAGTRPWRRAGRRGQIHQPLATSPARLVSHGARRRPNIQRAAPEDGRCTGALGGARVRLGGRRLESCWTGASAGSEISRRGEGEELVSCHRGRVSRKVGHPGPTKLWREGAAWASAARLGPALAGAPGLHSKQFRAPAPPLSLSANNDTRDTTHPPADSTWRPTCSRSPRPTTRRP